MKELTIKEMIDPLSVEDLISLKEHITGLIKEKKKETPTQRSEDRIKIKLLGTCTIAREREFINTPHRITISDLSPEGISFKTTALIYEKDILTITFRSPHTGLLKDVYAEVKRVGKSQTRGMVQVGALGISIEDAKRYRKRLEQRAKREIK